MRGVGNVHVHAPSPGGIPSHPHDHSACAVYVCGVPYPMVRYSLAGQDTRLSPERLGLKSRWRKLGCPRGQHAKRPARACLAPVHSCCPSDPCSSPARGLHCTDVWCNHSCSATRQILQPWHVSLDARSLPAGAHGVVASHPLRMRKALGSNPRVSTAWVLEEGTGIRMAQGVGGMGQDGIA